MKKTLGVFRVKNLQQTSLTPAQQPAAACPACPHWGHRQETPMSWSGQIHRKNPSPAKPNSPGQVLTPVPSAHFRYRGDYHGLKPRNSRRRSWSASWFQCQREDEQIAVPERDEGGSKLKHRRVKVPGGWKTKVYMSFSKQKTVSPTCI